MVDVFSETVWSLSTWIWCRIYDGSYGFHTCQKNTLKSWCWSQNLNQIPWSLCPLISGVPRRKQLWEAWSLQAGLASHPLGHPIQCCEMLPRNLRERMGTCFKIAMSRFTLVIPGPWSFHLTGPPPNMFCSEAPNHLYAKCPLGAPTKALLSAREFTGWNCYAFGTSRFWMMFFAMRNASNKCQKMAIVICPLINLQLIDMISLISWVDCWVSWGSENHWDPRQGLGLATCSIPQLAHFSWSQV